MWSVKNAHGIKVNRCCASCQHKCFLPDGSRYCSLMMIKVKQKFICDKWQISDGMRKAGRSGGVVRDIETKAIAIR